MPKQRKVSEEFWNALISSGRNVIDCTFCGRTHYVEDPGSDYDEGELKRLNARNKKNPDKVVFHQGDISVSWGNLDGKQAVYGCPCNSVRKYEDFIWDNRYLIANYLTARALKMKKEAKENSKLARMVQKATTH